MNSWEMEVTIKGRKLKFVQCDEDEPLLFVMEFVSGENSEYDIPPKTYRLYRDISCDAPTEHLRMSYPDYEVTNCVRRDFTSEYTLYSGKEITDPNFMQTLLEHILEDYIY